jgi:hypothetical protein
LYSVDDRIINEYGAVGAMRIDKGNWSIWRKPSLVPLCPPQSHMTWPGIDPGPPQWEATN